jgi:hypothetical protein
MNLQSWDDYDTIGKIYTRYIIEHSKCQHVDKYAYTNTIEGFSRKMDKKTIPFDELLLKTINVKPRKMRKKK